MSGEPSAHRVRRAERYMAQPAPRPGPEAPRLPWWERLIWPLLPKRKVPAFYASPNMAPPLGACGASDLEGRPGALTSYTEFGGDSSGMTVFEVCCPGCGGLVARLDPDRQPVRGADGQGGYGNGLTAVVPIWFRGCCGWYGTLRQGVWTGRHRPTISLRGMVRGGVSLIGGVNATRPPRDGD